MSPRSVAVLLLLSAPLLLSGATTIVRVWPSYREAESFRRISEYVGGTENSGREIVLRTQPEAHAGYYLLTRIQADDAAAGAALLVEVVLPGDPTIRTFSFPGGLRAGEHVYQIGITGTDWPSAKTRAAAWRVSARAASGETLAELTSFLWSAPAETK